ncbi:hypothetical protein [African swine fever virus]
MRTTLLETAILRHAQLNLEEYLYLHYIFLTKKI